MKNLTLITLILFATVQALSQNYTVSFKNSDLNTAIDSMQAINLATNDTVNMKGIETLTLINLTSGISSFLNMKGNIFPNPCNGSATLQFSTSADEDATIQVLNASGQLVMGKKQAISAGTHSFSVKFPSSGIYFVLVRAGNQVLSFKELSNMVGMQEASLSYLGSSQRLLETATLKSATTGKTLNYSTGNNIMYTLYSGKNIHVMVDKPTTSKNYDVAFYECADKDGKNYKTVTIGTQTWMAENLAYLPSITPRGTYSAVSCYYVYDYYGKNVSDAKATANYAIYGVLYNWPAAMNGESSSIANPSGVQGVCPAGWHLPSDAEWTTLSNYLGTSSVAGGKMKSVTGWKSPNTDSTNESGFSALPGGSYYLGKVYDVVGEGGDWWSSTECMECNAGYVWIRYLSHYTSGLSKYNNYEGNGLSV